MKGFIGALGVSIALLTAQAGAQTHTGDQPVTKLGVIVAMEKTNIVGTEAHDDYSPYGDNVGRSTGAALGGFWGALIGSTVGALADYAVNQSRTEIEGYNIKVKFDDGTTIWKPQRTRQVEVDKLEVGARVSVKYTYSTSRFQLSDAPLPANIPVETASVQPEMTAWEGTTGSASAQMSWLDAPAEGISISVNRK
jgi:outer membrane lipoprotein SlyB